MGLARRAGRRGARHRPGQFLYDGRSSAAQNWHEQTGLAAQNGHGVPGAGRRGPVAWSPETDGALRYAVAVPQPDGGTRFYYEAARADGGHDLRTELVSSPSAG